MRILITNYTLLTRSGTETYVRDLALGLLARGHSPIVYSPRIGSMADELRKLTIPVVDDLNRISTDIDLIHGHHRHETMTALLHFPKVPAVFFVHDWHAWHDLPPLFPRILRYVAVDDTRRDRLLLENGIPEAMVTILPNGVDTQRFCPRAPLPERPRRGLIFSNNVKRPAEIRELRETCSRLGIGIDVVGAGVKRLVTAPERVLGGYDLVFAMGRSALEAMAVGTGVIIWGLEGLGGFVHTGNFSYLQNSNFGRRALRPASITELETEIRRFDRAEAHAVQQRVRSTLAQPYLIERHLNLYREVLDEAAARAWEPSVELRMAATYMKTCRSTHQDVELHRREAPSRMRQRRRLIDVAWASLTLFVIGLCMCVASLALNERSFGLLIGTIAMCLLSCFGMFTLRRHLRGHLIV